MCIIIIGEGFHKAEERSRKERKKVIDQRQQTKNSNLKIIYAQRVT